MDDKEDMDLEGILHEAKEAFERAVDYESENRQTALDDIKFSRLDEQWPDKIIKQREIEGRPHLTINKLPAFIRQVVNDSRQNKPSIKVHPVDSNADVETADVINGLIRNIEYTSNADVAYDTAIEASVSGGFGYWRIGLDYAYEDVFDMDISIDRVANQFSIYGDPDSTCADSSDWNSAFVIEPMTKDQFKAKYKKKKNFDGDPVNIDFDSDAWSEATKLLDDDTVYIAEWWTREEVEEEIFLYTGIGVVTQSMIDGDPDIQVAIESGMAQLQDKRTSKSYKVKQTILTGADVLDVREWPGCYIPIVPVYGDEIIVEGKRYFRSLIHNAKDAQRMFNYWRTTSTELVALAPRVPWIGRKGTFDSDVERWNTANSQSHAFLEFDTEPPQRQPLDVGPAAGALQEALNASDDMKAIIGIYDASLGARSNETSGRAIMARQREGDVATFHFIDNLSRAIRHTGRILIDLIPKVYTKERVLRILGEDGTPESVQVNKPFPKMDENGQPVQQPMMGPNGQPVVDEQGNKVMEAVMAMHDLTTGKYDLTVTTGPSFTTRREEAAAQMTELVRAFPQAAPFIADIMAKNFDWPGADEIAKRFEAMNPANQQQQIPPELQKMIEDGKQMIAQLQQENAKLKADTSIDQFDAETKRLKVVGDLQNNKQKVAIDAADRLMTMSAQVPAEYPTR